MLLGSQSHRSLSGLLALTVFQHPLPPRSLNLRNLTMFLECYLDDSRSFLLNQFCSYSYKISAHINRSYSPRCPSGCLKCRISNSPPHPDCDFPPCTLQGCPSPRVNLPLHSFSPVTSFMSRFLCSQVFSKQNKGDLVIGTTVSLQLF